MLPESTVAWVALLATALGAVFSYAIVPIARRREADTPRVKGYAAYLVAAGTWATAYTLILLSPTETLAYVFDFLLITSALSTAWLFLLFTVNYTGNRDRLARPIKIAFGVDLVLYGSVYATETIHGQLFARYDAVTVDGLTVLAQEPNSLYLAHFLVVIACVVYGIWLLARFALATRNVYRKQTVVILLGALAATTASGVVIFNLAGAGTWQYFDPTPIAFGLNSILVTWALFRLDFLTVGPLAANTLIEEMNDAVLVLDDDDNILDANPRANALISRATASSATDQLAANASDAGTTSGDVDAFDASVEADALDTPLQEVLPGVAAAMDVDEPIELESPTEQGETSIFDVNVTPLRGPYDVRRGSLVVLRDVTERIERERLLKRRNEQLDGFADVVSHDLRNPLGVAKGYAERAEQTGDPEDVAEVRVALERMDELVEDLLALARSDRDDVDAAPVAIDQIADVAWGTVETDEATLSVATDAVVRAEESRLRQVFENLFRNAIEHATDAPAGGDSDDSRIPGSRDDRVTDGGGVDEDAEAAVSVTVGELDDGFFVADDGPGIPEADREEVFDSGFSTAEDGTGYGLAIVASVADAHDWELDLAASDCDGARFEFRDVEFPRRD